LSALGTCYISMSASGKSYFSSLSGKTIFRCVLYSLVSAYQISNSILRWGHHWTLNWTNFNDGAKQEMKEINEW